MCEIQRAGEDVNTYPTEIVEIADKLMDAGYEAEALDLLDSYDERGKDMLVGNNFSGQPTVLFEINPTFPNALF